MLRCYLCNAIGVAFHRLGCVGWLWLCGLGVVVVGVWLRLRLLLELRLWLCVLLFEANHHSHNQPPKPQRTTTATINHHFLIWSPKTLTLRFVNSITMMKHSNRCDHVNTSTIVKRLVLLFIVWVVRVGRGDAGWLLLWLGYGCACGCGWSCGCGCAGFHRHEPPQSQQTTTITTNHRSHIQPPHSSFTTHHLHLWSISANAWYEEHMVSDQCCEYLT